MALARQRLLLKQQVEVQAFAHQQQLDLQAQHLVNKSLASGPHSRPAAVNAQHIPSDHERLNVLLNDACVLASQPPGSPFVMPYGNQPQQPSITNHGYFIGAGVPSGMTPGAPGVIMNVFGQEEMMQAIKKELKRLQQQ